jgi:hypothetical protein
MPCQNATARAILERGGAYVLALKGNQPALYEDVRLWLDDPATVADDACQTVDGDHGRIETRHATVAHDVAWLAERHDFPGLAAVAKVTATREIDGRSTTARRSAPWVPFIRPKTGSTVWATAAVEGPATLGQQLALDALAGREVDRHAPPRRRPITQRRPLPVIFAGGASSSASAVSLAALASDP